VTLATESQEATKPLLRRLSLVGGQIRSTQSRLQSLMEERDLLVEALEDLGVTKARCARAAGVTPEALYQYTKRRLRRG